MCMNLNLSGIPHLPSQGWLVSDELRDGPLRLEQLVLNNTNIDDEVAVHHVLSVARRARCVHRARQHRALSSHRRLSGIGEAGPNKLSWDPQTSSVLRGVFVFSLMDQGGVED